MNESSQIFGVAIFALRVHKRIVSRFGIKITPNLSLRAFFCEAVSLTIREIASPIKLARNDSISGSYIFTDPKVCYAKDGQLELCERDL